MTISGALNNAVMGLRAASRGAELISTNISNALTPGYARRELLLSSNGPLGGVQIDGVVRIADQSIAADRRNAEAAFSNADAQTNFYSRLEGLLGTPDEAGSLSARLADFESGLISAASRPDAPERLSSSVADAAGLVQSIRAASDGIQDARAQADRSIKAQVDTLNSTLVNLEELNSLITRTQVQGGNVSSLMDQRQQLVDQVAVIVPVREIPRDNGQIALYSTGGAVLLDGSAAEIGFFSVNTVTPYMTNAGGILSGLTLNGNDIPTDAARGALRGGTLAAQFQIRDEDGVVAQDQLDTLARDLIERFQSSAVDPTLAPGLPGLFTDGNGAFSSADTVGIADRIGLNAAVDPDQGGETWRLRDGLNAITPGDVGDATILQSLSAALESSRSVGGGVFSGGVFTATTLVSALVSEVGAQRTTAEQNTSFASARLAELTERQLADGVDSDTEIQRLLQIEQNYAANARLIETLDEMMQTILRL